MDENPINDVNTPADTSTVADSSSVEQTPAENEVQSTPENGDIALQNTAGDKTVPYDRFKEVNDNFRQTQAELKAMREQQDRIAQSLQPQQPAEVIQAKQQLAGLIKELAPELGFVSKEEMTRTQAVNEVKSEHDRLASKYNGKDGLPKYDPQAVTDYALQLGMTSAKGLEIAYKQMHDAEIMNARIQKAMQQTRGVQSETSNGTGSANAGVTNDDLKKAAQEGDKDAVHLLLKRRLSKS